MRANLDQRTIKRLIKECRKNDSELVVWDTHRDAPVGFGLRIMPSGLASFMIQWRDARGKSARYKIEQFGKVTLEEARKRARETFAGITDRKNPVDPRARDRQAREAQTMAELCDAYQKDIEAGVRMTRRGVAKKASTIATDRGRIERHIKPLLGKLMVREVTPLHVRGFMADVIRGKTAVTEMTKLRGKAVVKGGRGTAARTMGLLGAIMQYAVDHGHRANNPVHGIERPKDGKRKQSVPLATYKMLGEILRAAESAGEPWQPIEMIRLIALTGCRRSEIVNLRRSEVDLNLCCLRLTDSKTGASIRPLGEPARDLLRRALERNHGAEHVFDFRRGRPYLGLPKARERIMADRPELKKLTPHVLRHGFGSIGANKGLPKEKVGALLGNGGYTVTENYMHYERETLLRAADLVAGAIWQAMDGSTAEVLPFPGAA